MPVGIARQPILSWTPLKIWDVSLWQLPEAFTLVYFAQTISASVSVPFSHVHSVCSSYLCACSAYDDSSFLHLIPGVWEPVLPQGVSHCFGLCCNSHRINALSFDSEFTHSIYDYGRCCFFPIHPVEVLPPHPIDLLSLSLPSLKYPAAVFVLFGLRVFPAEIIFRWFFPPNAASSPLGCVEDCTASPSWG